MADFTLGFTGSDVNNRLAKVDDLTSAVNDMLNRVYPIGSIYISTSSTNPHDLFGGTWATIGGRFLLGQDSSHAAGSTGGSWTHSHRYAFQYGAYYRALAIESNSKAGILNYDTDNNVTPVGTGTSIGAYDSTVNNAASSSAKTVSMTHYRQAANTSYVSAPPLTFRYICGRGRPNHLLREVV